MATIIQQIHKGWLVSAVVFLLILPASSWGQTVSGRSFTTFIYSDLVEEATTTLSFETNGTLLISSYSGFGLYLAVGPVFAGSFSAPNFAEKSDLFLVLTGAVLSDVLSGVGLAYKDNSFYEFFLFFGYAQ